MGHLILDRLFFLLAVVWRRHKLLAWPLALGVPLSMLAAYAAPRTYVARTMFLLQEGSSDLPLARELRPTESSNEKVGGLRALLRSDRVLGAVAREIYGAEVRGDPVRLAQRRKELEDRVSMWSEAPEFIELRLSGTQPAGLGHTLELISSKLLESVLSSGASLAPQVVTGQLAQKVSDLQARLDHLRSANRAADARASAGQAKPPTERAVRETAEELQRAGEDLQVRLAALGAGSLALNQSKAWLAQQSELVTSEIAQLQAAGISGERRTAARTRLLEIEQALKAEGAFQSATTQAQQLRMARPSSETASSEQERQQIEAELVAAQTAYQAMVNRFQAQVGSSGPSFLRAPERIMVIDPPRDPELPTRSRSLLFLIGLLSAVLLAVGAVALAELLDMRIRTPGDLLEASSVPLLGRLPASALLPV